MQPGLHVPRPAAHVLEADRLERQLFRWTAGDRVEADVGQHLVEPQPCLAAAVGVDHARRGVGEPRTEPAVEHIGRLDDVVVGREDRRPGLTRLGLGQERDRPRRRAPAAKSSRRMRSSIDMPMTRQSKTSGSVRSSWRTAPSQNVGGHPSFSPGFIGRAHRGIDRSRHLPDHHRVVRELAHPLEGHRVVARLTDGATGDEATMVREQHRGRAPHLLGEEDSRVCVAHEPVVLVDEREVAVEDARVLVDEGRRHAEAGEQGHGIGVTVHDDGRVGTGAMELRVDEHRARRAPLAVDHLAVGTHQHDVGGLRLLPPDPPRVAPEIVGSRLRPCDVTRHVLLPSRLREDAQRGTRAPVAPSASRPIPSIGCAAVHAAEASSCNAYSSTCGAESSMAAASRRGSATTAECRVAAHLTNAAPVPPDATLAYRP